ncbi:MAG: YicC family protein [Verrucomicrobiales bacterium]|nr:YicC family protein [Verrucomicrobiales bacterium]
MTGYGRGCATHGGYRVTVELSSVNRKQADIQVNLPRELEALESRVRDEINRHIARGRLTARISLAASDAAAARHLHVNRPLAKAYAREFTQLATSLRLEASVSLDTILRAPGVLQPNPETTDADEVWPALEQALTLGLKALLRMRQREGRHLAKDLRTRISALRTLAKTVAGRAPEVAERYRALLLDRIRATGLAELAGDDERLLKEVAFFAERSDITEEITRLESHFQQFDECASGGEPVGRMLDFLAQEMNREVNTIGSKANDSVLSRAVVAMKAELERFREQVQNVE